MSQRVAWRFGARVVVMLVGLAALLAACAKDPVRVDRNRPPTTYLVAAPPESGSFSYRIHLYWRGEDADGFVAGYQWAWDDSSVSSFRFTTRTDSIFELSVNDSATVAGGTSNQPPGTSRGHTFFIRAVDNLGKPDPSLTIWNHRIIISTTLKPEVEFTGSLPSGNGVDSLCDGAPFKVCWDGTDPDGFDANGNPDTRVIGYKFDVGPYSSPIVTDSCVSFNDPNDPNSIALSSGIYTLTVQAVDKAYALSDQVLLRRESGPGSVVQGRQRRPRESRRLLHPAVPTGTADRSRAAALRTQLDDSIPLHGLLEVGGAGQRLRQSERNQRVLARALSG